MAAAMPIPEAPPVMTATLLGDMATWGTRVLLEVSTDLPNMELCRRRAPTMHEPAWEVFVPRDLAAGKPLYGFAQPL
jgi:hypothetical protein